MITELQRRTTQWYFACKLADLWNLQLYSLFNWANDYDIDLDEHFNKWRDDDKWIWKYYIYNKPFVKEE